MLESTGLPYRVHPVDLGRQEQFAPSFLEIARLKEIVDREGPGGRFQRSRAVRILAGMTRHAARS